LTLKLPIEMASGLIQSGKIMALIRSIMGPRQFVLIHYWKI